MRTKLAAEEPEELVIDRNGRLLPALGTDHWRDLV